MAFVIITLYLLMILSLSTTSLRFIYDLPFNEYKTQSPELKILCPVSLLKRLKQFLANNYKDQAHAMREKLHTRAVELHDAGKLRDELFSAYEKQYEAFTERMKNYNHREFYHS